MSNSNPCARRTVIFNDNKTFIGPQFCKIQQILLLKTHFISKSDRNYSVILKYDEIAVGRMEQAMGQHAARRPPV
jgi:hypothetical protein